MTEINQISNLFKNFGGIKFAAKQQETEKSLLASKTTLDTVSLNSNKSEKFEDVFAEFDKNVPDCTSTITEKELAISYIDRMLACDDISDDMKIYWQNKKSVIKMEIQSIKNEETKDTGEKVNDVWNEYEKFVNKYQGKVNDNLSAEDKYEYSMTYNKTAQSFIKRLMNCADVTDKQLLIYQQMYQNFENDMQNCRRDFMNAKK